MVYNEKLWIDSLKPQFNIKKIVNRPYFPDELQFNKEEFIGFMRTIKSPLESLSDWYGKDYFFISVEERKKRREERGEMPKSEFSKLPEEVKYKAVKKFIKLMDEHGF